MLRYLLVALGAVAIVVFATPTLSSAATVSCGRVTTFVAPDSAGALTTGDGWMILAKADGSSEKIIIRSGRLTSTGSIGGYVCVSVDGLYFNGVLAPGTAGYIPVSGLPATSTAGASSDQMQVLVTLAVALAAALSLYGLRRRLVE